MSCIPFLWLTHLTDLDIIIVPVISQLHLPRELRFFIGPLLLKVRHYVSGMDIDSDKSTDDLSMELR